jgi:uncharacterized protein YunC (DUF1805 family)
VSLLNIRCAIAKGKPIWLPEKNMDLNAFEKHFIQLKSPLLLIQGGKGVLACGYLNIETFNKTGEAAAIVTGVRTHEDMLKAKVIAVSIAARAIGVEIGTTGEDALAKFA